MDGHSYAVLIVSVAVAAAAFDVIRVYRRLPKRLADGEAAAVDSVPAETVPPNTQAATAERNFGLVLASRAVFVALAVIAAGLLWSAEDDQHWTQDKVLHEAEKIAADMQAGGQTPGDGATPGAGSFKTLVDTEVQAVVKGNGLGLTDDFATPPPGAVDSYVITGTKADDRTGEAEPTKYRACLVITSADPVPNGLPTTSGISQDVHDYAIRTKVTSGNC
ncbi:MULTISPECIES: hypothetical protein [unclassified Streptomyces]|uniref:hypothetical protein n=1 Tax=unclassified Streptomyces TaxID=2593676 RepID=UPI0022550E2B|nr:MULTISPECIES: hypothetical protein [unclassified Streptomyces]MCX5050247.1 hypothetical protein [Streptomyces sp. NBC_00474]MCX5060624.1 hypothetical protein [Streptomyces sp. NBC_00452]MCX5248159.1 hypothetical protein [Streptomyces sp. NBC_00201]